MSKTFTHLHVRALNLRSTQGLLVAGGLQFRCSLGRSGRKWRKREGDGATPMGVWQLRRLFYRADRMRPPRSGIVARPIRDVDGWCETLGDRNYNRLVPIPYASEHEFMKRVDGLYDVVVELSHNERPRVQGHGSAVFFHLRRADGSPTAGCIGVSLKDMTLILQWCGRKTRIVV